jgi:hypothetical protein
MTAKQDAKQASESHRENKQPYATESENYRFDIVNPPTEPTQRQAGKDSDGRRGKVAHPRRDGTSNDEGEK